ncbi:MAG: hypothetical protein QGG53_05550 [Planctomycetota bacterium]|nr:hypothetical protein [Planctomycetota bacterium]
MKKIRLAFLHEYLPFGGVEQHILQLCRHLDRSRFSITLLLSRLGGPMMPLFEELGIPIEIFPVAPVPGPSNLPASLALIERLKEFSC